MQIFWIFDYIYVVLLKKYLDLSFIKLWFFEKNSLEWNIRNTILHLF